MPPTTIHAAPALDSFTPLAEHQAQTPTSFYNTKPVLHYHATGIRALAERSQLSKLPIFAAITEGQAEGAGGPKSEVSVEALVSSE